MQDMKISPHFTLKEATKTSQPFDNSPDNDEDLATIQRTSMCMELIRQFLGGPINVNSWYRSTAVNNAVGGVADSQHKLGEAVDFTCPAFGSPFKICKALEPMLSRFGIDQLILEPTWVHVSFCTSRVNRGRAPRNQLLTMKGGKYFPGIQQL